MKPNDIDLKDVHGSVRIRSGGFFIEVDKCGFVLFHGNGDVQRSMIDGSSLFRNRRISLSNFFARRNADKGYAFEML